MNAANSGRLERLPPAWAEGGGVLGGNDASDPGEPGGGGETIAVAGSLGVADGPDGLLQFVLPSAPSTGGPGRSGAARRGVVRPSPATASPGEAPALARGGGPRRAVLCDTPSGRSGGGGRPVSRGARAVGEPVEAETWTQDAPSGLERDLVGVVRRLLASSRFFITLAVLGAFLTSVALLIYAAMVAVVTIVHVFRLRHEPVDIAHLKDLSVDVLELVDAFLLGTVVYIVALGLYLLFVDPLLPLPEWLHIRDIDELKAKVVAVIVVLLGVSFLPFVVAWEGGRSILYLGLAVAAVIAALSFLLLVTARARRPGGGDHHE
jgi:uncharacterized membrane protein YqhA